MNQFSALAASRMRRNTIPLQGQGKAVLDHIAEAPEVANMSDDEDRARSDREDGDEMAHSRGAGSKRPRLANPSPAKVSVSSFIPSRSNTVLISDPATGHHFALLGMEDGEDFVFEGAVGIACLRGNCSVAGFTIGADRAVNSWMESDTNEFAADRVLFHQAYSLKTHGLLRLVAGERPDSLGEVPRPPLACEKLSRAPQPLLTALAEHRRRFVDFSCVLLLIDLGSSGFADLDKEANIRDVLASADENETLNAMSLVPGASYISTLSYPGPKTALTLPADWLNALSALTRTPLCRANPIIAVVGPKGSGKSTFARMLVNSFLSLPVVSTVSFLDTDIGQTEFTPYGAVSLQTVCSPLLGPPYTHGTMPDRCLYFGSASPERDPDYYLDCLRELVDSYRNAEKQVPLIVNTHGWVKGMGYDMLAYFLGYLRPSAIVELRNAENEARNVAGDLSLLASGFADEGSAATKVIQIKAMDSSLQTSRWTPAELRNLMTTTYFYRRTLGVPCETRLSTIISDGWIRNWDLAKSPAAAEAYAVPWSRLKFQTLHGETARKHALWALNGTIVALCQDLRDLALDQSAGDAVDNALEPIVPARHNVLGMGVVRGIEAPFGRHTPILHLVTPLPMEVVARCNLLLRGGDVDLPISMLTAGLPDGSANPPYTIMASVGGAGGKEWKARSNVGRRSQA